MPDNIIFFDGVCNLCNRLVIFIIQRDHHHIFNFAPLQSSIATEMGLFQKGTNSGSILFYSNHQLYQKSIAILRICRLLPFPWPLLFGFIIVPRFIRDSVYNFVARNRYNWFGKKRQCMVPSKDIEDRFLN